MSDFGSNQRERQSSALVGGCFIWVIWSLRGGASSETDPCTRGWSASWKGFKFSILLLEGTPMAALILFNKSLRMSNEDEKIMYSKMLIWSGFKAMYLFIKWLRWRQKSEFVDGYAWIHVIEDVRLCLNLWMILFAVLFILWEKKNYVVEAKTMLSKCFIDQEWVICLKKIADATCFQKHFMLHKKRCIWDELDSFSLF